MVDADGRVNIRADLPSVVFLFEGRRSKKVLSLTMGPPRARPARKRRNEGLPDSVSNGSRALNALSCANRNASP